MNKRQRKKIARFINDYHYKKTSKYGFSCTECPQCGWDALDDEEFVYQKITDERHGHPEWIGYFEFDVDVKCPYCGKRYSYADANM